MNYRLIKVFAVAASLMAGAAHADILFENGSTNNPYSGNNPFAYQEVTDDFFIGANSVANSFTYNAFTTGSTVPVSNVQLNVYANNSGSKGALLLSGSFSVAAVNQVGTYSGYNLTDYSVNLPSWNLAAGTYFVGLQVSPKQWDMHWSIPNQTYGATGSDGFDHYFRFEGAAVSAVPEPETYALLLSGLGVMGCIARRRKAKQA